MERLTAIWLLTFFAILSCRREEVDEYNAFVGNRTPGDTALLFAPGIISSDSFEHSSPAFSPDGKTVLWSIVEMPSWKATIMEINYKDGKWTEPRRASFGDTTVSDIYPSFSPDGEYVYFSSGRKLPSGQVPNRGNALWRVKKTASGWTIPEPLDTAVSKGGEYSPSISKNGNLYFTYGPFRSPDWNIVIAQKINGSFQRRPLPHPVNTPGYEDGPFVAPDESYLIFESDRPEGIGGSIDLYISFKSKNGNWTAPVNLGSTVNSSASERFARVSSDGKFLFFGSNRRQVEDKPNFDIYWVDASFIATLRDQTADSER